MQKLTGATWNVRPLSRLLRARWGLTLALVVALVMRLPLLSTNFVPFNSDEAVVGLMAKHILDGAVPTFFYGQAYMGSLDALLIAGSFTLFGEQVLAIRLVQLVLYLAFVAGLWLLIHRLYRNRQLANWGACLAAVPPLLVTTYTTATLGGYGEILLLELVVLYLGFHTLVDDGASPTAWVGLGLAAGVAFWTLGLSAVYLAPVGLFHLLHPRRQRMRGYFLALLAFVVGSSPWWLFNWRHGGEAIRALTSGTPMESTIGQRALGLFSLGLPALLGLRAPWSSSFVSLPLLYLGVVLALAILAFNLKHLWERRARISIGSWLLIALGFSFMAAFLGTQFGIDATGRYLLPLYPILVVGGARLLRGAARWHVRAGPALLLVFWLTYGLTTLQAATSPSRITTQFDPITRFGNRHDERLIHFLDEVGVDRGYSNHWVAYRLAFLTDERILLAAELPYKADLRYTDRDQRIPAYGRQADAAEDIVYVTSKHPELDGRLRAEFQRAGIEFLEASIGPYHLFYGFSKPLRPERLQLGLEGGPS